MRGLVLLILAMTSVGLAQAQQGPTRSGVLVYGATPAGIAAALAAADDGENVLLIEPSARIGGLAASGLSHTDLRTFEGLSGAFLDYSRRVQAYYAAKYGADSPQVRDSLHGVFAEPSVALAVFREMLAERKTATVATGARLTSVATTSAQGRPHVTSATFVKPDGTAWTVAADVFIDATYEGDLLAAAGVPYRVGREGRAEFGESLAPEQPDGELQAYNFRLIMTRDPRIRVAPPRPAGYRREDYQPVLEMLKAGRFRSIFGYPDGCIFKAHVPPLPNAKYDINDVSKGLIRLSLPGRNLGWPEGGPAERERIAADHMNDTLGLLYFLQNDEEVPAQYREEAASWGLCRDEFEETGGLPPQLYVREARRMEGAFTFTQKDAESLPDENRAVLHADSIAVGDYGNNCHGTNHEGPRFGGRHTGEFYKVPKPYQIPYGVLTPKQVDNLLAPGAASSSHVGFCALRLEPIWMSLGQAAGHAAHLARVEARPVQSVPIVRLQESLHRAGSATIYVSDVPPGSPDFEIVQTIGTAGGLHGLAPTSPPGPHKKRKDSPYLEAFPNHAASLDAPLDAPLAARWRKLAEGLGLRVDGLPEADGRTTRGDWLRAAARPSR
ncbi:FAD-dependent oxidoreductase [Paludisphaera rhizosphaerae]|uniref:FAD-dependent oxidoreductase n=1 Tax=Paludisphaera rhizosphaerae TaxID=2711216 RepID=UPI0019820F8F|nr:FAD-dependent oxidoreductase [Paludisphaera rhizosphaerae]